MIVATNNKNKLNEIKKILTGYKIYSLKDKEIYLEIAEDQETFLDNAKKKAIEVYKIAKEEVVADDSGLCINCLDGFPGVMTHRFLGENATDRMRNEYLINRVSKYIDRSARVICALSYYNGKNIVTCEGVLDGFIAKTPRGSNGFGFDEIFELPNGLTLAELAPVEKNKLSARAIALKNLKEALQKWCR